MSTMKALVWKDLHQVELELQRPIAAISDDEVLVRVKAEGICTTDIHMVNGKLDFAKPPWVLGHELSGVIDRVGRNVSSWAAGDSVIIDPVVSCGSCRYCLTGKKHLCPEGGELGTTYGSGGYGEFVIVKPNNLYRLPAELSFVEGAMMEPLNCTLGAIDRVRNMAGSRVAVFGAGPAGLLFVQLAKAYGAVFVVLVDKNEERLALGKRLGADEVVDFMRAPVAEYLTGLDIDVAVEASGSAQAVKDGFDAVAPSGTVVLYGLNALDQPTIVSDQIVGKDLTVVTCISAPLLWDKGIRLVQSGLINVKDMVTQQVDILDAKPVIDDILHGRSKAVKTMITYS